MYACCVFVCHSGFYYTSPSNSHPAEPSSPLPSPAAVSLSRDESQLDVHSYIISARDDNSRPSRARPRDPLESSHLGHQPSVVTQSQRNLSVVSADVHRSPSCREVPRRPTDPRSSSVHVQRPGRRRRRDDVAETSFTETSSSGAQHHDIAVQVSLPKRPVAMVVPQLPRMGKLAMHRKSTSGENFDQSSSVLTADPGLGGSLPCLAGDELVSDRHQVGDGMVLSELNTLASSSQGTGRTTSSIVKNRSYLSCDDEGYLTKESSTSTSSAGTRRCSPVFF